MEIEGLTLEELRTLPSEELDELMAFGRPIVFRMGSATILAEFNAQGSELKVNLAHVDGGGEGVLVSLWKAIAHYASDRDYEAIQWKVHALTCANPNPRLQEFLRSRGFTELSDEAHGRVLALTQGL